MLKMTAADEIMNYFLTSSSETEERRVLGEIIRFHLSEKGSVNNKDIILSLVSILETTKDGELQDIYRNVLQKVVGQTSDDI